MRWVNFLFGVTGSIYHRRLHYFPSLLEPRRRSERALLAVIQQAYVEGVSTRRVDDLVKALGCEGYFQEPGVAHLSGTGRGGGWLHGPSAGRWTLPLPVAGRTDPEGQGGRQDRQRQRGGGDGRQWRGQSGEIIGMDVGTSEDGAFLAGLPYARCPPGASAGWSWWYRTLIRDSEAPSPQSSAEPAGNGAAPTS